MCSIKLTTHYFTRSRIVSIITENVLLEKIYFIRNMFILDQLCKKTYYSLNSRFK